MPDSYQPPISGEPHDPFEKYRIAGIQKEKEPHDASEGTEAFQPKRPSGFLGYAILILKKFIEIFEHTTEHGLTTSAQKEIFEHLAQFKSSLEILRNEDRSQDSLFLNQLAQIWHLLLDDSYSFRRNTLLSVKVRAFIKKLQHHSERQGHSLGYYLTEYAGQKWLPFPYMDMIRHLHMESMKNQENSHLATWSKDVDEMLLIIKPLPQN